MFIIVSLSLHENTTWQEIGEGCGTDVEHERWEMSVHRRSRTIYNTHYGLCLCELLT